MALTKICQHCHSEFKARNDRSQFCMQPDCRRALDRANHRRWYHHRDKVYECVRCHQTFMRRGQGQHAYCSQTCLHAGPPLVKLPPRACKERRFAPRPCRTCHRIFERRSTNHRYCSAACYPPRPSRSEYHRAYRLNRAAEKHGLPSSPKALQHRAYRLASVLKKHGLEV